MMKKVRGMGKGFFILSALLLMFAVVGCDDSDSTEDVNVTTDERPGVAGVSRDSEVATNNDTVTLNTSVDTNGDSDTKFQWQGTVTAFRNGVAIPDNEQFTITVESFDFDGAADEFGEGLQAGEMWQTAGFARFGFSGDIDDVDFSNWSGSMLLCGDAVLGGQTIREIYNAARAAGNTPRVSLWVWGVENDVFQWTEYGTVEIVDAGDGFYRVSFAADAANPIAEIENGVILSIMKRVPAVDVNISISDPDKNTCTVSITASVESGYTVSMLQKVRGLGFVNSTGKTIEVPGLYDPDDDTISVSVEFIVWYEDGNGNRYGQRFDRDFNVRCESGSGGLSS